MGVGRVHRLLRLITLLQSGRARSVQDLTSELEVSRRTLFRDLNMLELAGIPYFHDAAAGYRISESYFLPPVNLSVTETLGLMLLAKSAASQRNRPLHGAALSAINKLITSVPDPIRAACSDLMSHISIDPGTAPVSDIEARHHPILQTCIDESRACTMRYKGPLENSAIECVLEPYAMHSSPRGWYVLGKSALHGEVRVFKLSRIESITPMQRLFTRPRRFRVEDKIGKAWRLIPEGKIYAIELEFTAMVAANVAEVRWHQSQRSERLGDGRLRVWFEVDGLSEIAWWLCGYADQVKVIAPPQLKRKVAGMLRLAAAQYDGEGV